MVERAFRLVHDKTVALLRDVKEGKTDRRWAEAMNYACDMSNIYVTTSIDQGISPFELWYGRPPSFDGLLPFGTVGYMKRLTPAHKLAPRGANKCILLGTSANHSHNTFRCAT